MCSTAKRAIPHTTCLTNSNPPPPTLGKLFLCILPTLPKSTIDSTVPQPLSPPTRRVIFFIKRGCVLATKYFVENRQKTFVGFALIIVVFYSKVFHKVCQTYHLTCQTYHLTCRSYLLSVQSSCLCR